MTIDDWLAAACADADRRGLPELRPLLESLADATRDLRAVAWDDLLQAHVPATAGEEPEPGSGRAGGEGGSAEPSGGEADR